MIEPVVNRTDVHRRFYFRENIPTYSSVEQREPIAFHREWINPNRPNKFALCLLLLVLRPFEQRSAWRAIAALKSGENEH